MATFNDREKAAEAKFSHDQETDFKVMARRNKLLGLWVAEYLDIVGDEAEEITVDESEESDEV